MDSITLSQTRSETFDHENAPAAEPVPERQKLPEVATSWELEYEVEYPEHRLYQALLFRAYSDATSACACAQHVQREARDWVHSNETHFLSFLWVCEQLNMSTTGIAVYRSYIPVSLKAVGQQAAPFRTVPSKKPRFGSEA